MGLPDLAEGERVGLDPGVGEGDFGLPAGYTVGQYLKDWLETLNTQAESTVTGYRIMARQLIELIGNVKLADLTVRDVQFALGTLAKRLSTRSVRLARMILIQAMRNAMMNEVVARNLEVGTVATAIALGPLFDSKAKTPGGQS